MTVQTAYQYLFIGALIVMITLIGTMLIRSIIGPRITDRIMCINMIGTMVITCISILSGLLDESWLIDVALIYAMISFVSVLIMTSIYVPKNPVRGKFQSDTDEEEAV